MLAYTYHEKGKFALMENPAFLAPTDAIVRGTVNVETVCGECLFCKKGLCEQLHRSDEDTP